jgi:hypothetical protein
MHAKRLEYNFYVAHPIIHGAFRAAHVDCVDVTERRPAWEISTHLVLLDLGTVTK